MRKLLAYPTVFAALILCFYASLAHASMDSAAITKFKTRVTANYQDEQAYSDFIAAMAKAGVVGKGEIEDFERLIEQTLDPKKMKGIYVNLDGMEAYHRLGLALYSEGYEEEAQVVLQKYTDTRKYTPEQGVKKAREVFDKYKQEHPD